jgi:hypothetical protein
LLTDTYLFFNIDIEMKNKTFYGMVLGFLALFGVASVVPAMAQGGGGTDWANPG